MHSHHGVLMYKVHIFVYQVQDLERASTFFELRLHFFSVKDVFHTLNCIVFNDKCNAFHALMSKSLLYSSHARTDDVQQFLKTFRAVEGALKEAT